jgi:hypothetical protein
MWMRSIPNAMKRLTYMLALFNIFWESLPDPSIVYGKTNFSPVSGGYELQSLATS